MLSPQLNSIGSSWNRAAFLIASILLTACGLSAQTFRGGIQGTVLDSSGAGVPDAEVVVLGTETNLSRHTNTDAVGNYAFTELPLGVYSVSATKAGFQKQVVSGITVTVGAAIRADLILAPGEAREIVEVVATIPLVETNSDTTGGTIEGEQASELPVNGRDFGKAVLLVPGAAADPSSSSDSPGSFGSFSMNGNRGRSNNYLLDGTDMNDGYRNDPAINESGVFGTPATLLPIDALAEIPVISNADAQFGRNSGAIVNIVTKSGTNSFHGAAFELFRNNALDARNFFNTTAVAQNPLHNNQFGGSLGGPIVKDRAFFFFAYEGQREYGGISALGHVPTPQDIATALASPTVVQAGGENPIIANLMARNPWPAPNMPTDANGNNLLATTPFTNTIDSLIGKVDYHFGEGDVLTGRYYFGNGTQSYPLALVGGGDLPGYNTITPTRVQLVSLSQTHVFSPRLLLELRAGYNRFFETFSPQDASFDPRSIGLNTAQGNDTGLPLLLVSGEAALGANSSVPRGRVDTNWQYFGNMSYSTGKHNWKWGYEFRRTFVNGYFDSGYRGRLLFPDLASFLAGEPGGTLTTGNHQATGDSRRGTFQNSHGLYLQDSIKLNQRLTLSAGVRWDYFGVIGEERGRFSIFDPSIPGPRPVKQLYPSDWNNFAPRVSLAYDVGGKGKTVIRAGWGLFYDAFSQDFFVGQLPFNTFNPGPAYNDVGSSPVLFSGTAALTLVPGPCTGTAVKVPNTNMCAPPVFSNFGASDVFTVDQHIRTPYVQNYNFNIQQQFTSGIALQVGYVGSAGRKLFRYRDLNQSVGGGPLPYPDFVYINQFESTAVSNYNGLQATLRLATHGVTAALNYAWAHSIDTASDGQDFVPNATQPDNSFNASNERASSNFDIRQHFSANFVYEFPKVATFKPLLSGWEADGIVTLQSGMPVNVNYLFEGDFNGSDEYFGRPDVVGNPFAGQHFPNTYLNAAAFAVPCQWDASSQSCVPGTQHFGNLGRNAFTGPPFKDFDFSLVKNNTFHEWLNVQFRVDFFNIFNHPNFSNPMLPAFGLDFLAGSMPDSNGRGIGSIPITATPDVGSGNPFLGGGGPRTVQLGLKFKF
ncbi:MAG: TonB-dependent receptor [Bryobacteraceae bacterium]|jgi:hypothetical protein